MDKTWVLVADRVRARVFEMAHKGAPLAEIKSLINVEGREPKGSRGDNRPVRTMESVGMARHAIEPRTTPEEKHAEKFARDLNAVLEQGHSQHDYDRLVLIAPPRFLGVMRAALGPQIVPLVSQEITHDLSEATAQEISDYMKA